MKVFCLVLKFLALAHMVNGQGLERGPGWILGLEDESCHVTCGNSGSNLECASGPMSQVDSIARLQFVADQTGASISGTPICTGQSIGVSTGEENLVPFSLDSGEGMCFHHVTDSISTCGSSQADHRRICCCTAKGNDGTKDCPVQVSTCCCASILISTDPFLPTLVKIRLNQKLFVLPVKRSSRQRMEVKMVSSTMVFEATSVVTRP